MIRTVKVGGITNLSDARYCAGMGVDMLGFTCIDNQPGYVSPAAFQELRGWFNGPSIVAEAYGLRNGEALREIIRNYLPDFIELGITELPFVDLPSVALIVAAGQASADDLLRQLAFLHNQVAFIILDGQMPSPDIRLVAEYYPVLLQLNKPADENLLKLPVKGFALKGGMEERPGLKSYDSLSEILDQLSED